MSGKNPKVDGYIRKSRVWQDELHKLRAILLGCGLTEDVKWRHPCYTFENRNIVILGRFKTDCRLTFVKGALLDEGDGVLVRAGENTHVARMIGFNSVQQIEELEAVLKTYLHKAIDLEKSGLKVQLKKNPEPVPAELQGKLDELPALKAAFAALTPGRQRAYILHFSAAKQSKTRAARVEKCIPQILRGKGLND